jgi:hypothetical protein
MSGLRRLSLWLSREGVNTQIKFYLRDEKSNLSHQLRFYELQGFSIKDENTRKEILAKEHSESQIVQKGGLLEDICWCMDATSTPTFKIASKYAKILEEKTKTDLGENELNEFLDYFRDNGLFDLMTYSLKSSVTLHILFILFDLNPSLASACNNYIKKHRSQLPLGYLKAEELTGKEPILWKPAVLSVLLDPLSSSQIFVDSIAYLNNRAFVLAQPQFGLLLGDLMDPEFLGFNHMDYMNSRVFYYSQGTKKGGAVETLCKLRVIGMYTSTMPTFLNKLIEISSKYFDLNSLARIESTANSPLENSISIMDAETLRGFFDKPINTKNEGPILPLLKAQLQIVAKQDTSTRIKEYEKNLLDKVRPNTCKGIQEDFIGKTQALIDSKSYIKAIDYLISKLRKQVTVERFAEILYFSISILKLMSDVNENLKKELNTMSTVDGLEKIQHLMLNYFFEKHISRGCLYALGRMYLDRKKKEGEEILRLVLTLVHRTPNDLVISRKCLNSFLKMGQAASLDNEVKDISNFITAFVAGLQTHEEVSDKVLNRVNEILTNCYLFEFSDEEIYLFSDSVRNELVRYSIINTLEEAREVFEGKRPPSSKPLGDSSMANIIKNKDYFDQRGINTKSDNPVPPTNQVVHSQALNTENSAIPPEEDGTNAQFKEAQKTLRLIVEDISKDDKIRLFDKEMFDIYGTVDNIPTFDYNSCRIFKAYFVSNNQKCTIFSVDYGEHFSIEVWKGLAAYLKTLHPKLICYYGVCLEVSESGNFIVNFVAENFDILLGSLTLEQVKRLDIKKKVLTIFDCMFALESIHAVGLAFFQLCPDLVTITNKCTKFIFPFFLRTRISFARNYLPEVLELDAISRNLMFIKPEALEDPHTLGSIKMNIFDHEFEEAFHGLMNADLYSFVMLTAFLFNPDHFFKPEYNREGGLATYLNKIKNRKEFFKDIVKPAEELGDKVMEEFGYIFTGDKRAKSTFHLFSSLKVQSIYEYPEINLMMVKRDLFETISYYGGENPGVGVYFPCGILMLPSEDVFDNKVFIGRRLLFVGPFFFIGEGESHQFDFFASDREMIHFEMSKGNIDKAKITFKEEKDGKLKVEQKILVEQFVQRSVMPQKNVLSALIDMYNGEKPIESKAKAATFLKTMKQMASVFDKLATEVTPDSNKVLIDPFGNFLRAERNTHGFPNFFGPIAIEPYSMHNFGKSFVTYRDQYKEKFFLSKISTFCVGDLNMNFGRYADIFNTIDTMNVGNAFSLSTLCFVYGGSIENGQPTAGNVVEQAGSRIHVESKMYSEGTNTLGKPGLTYKGELVGGKREGQGTIMKAKNKLYKGNFYRGYPNGKGKLFHNGQSAFLGYFRKGVPIYGLFNTKSLAIEGIVAVDQTQSTASSQPKLNGKDHSPNNKTSQQPSIDKQYIYDPETPDQKTYVVGFDIESSNPKPMICELKPDMTLLSIANTGKLIARDVTYLGECDEKSGLPNGRGTATIDKYGTITGKWDLKKREVVGVLVTTRMEKSPIKGVFTYGIDEKTQDFGIQGYGYSILPNGGYLEGECSEMGFNGTCMEKGIATEAKSSEPSSSQFQLTNYSRGVIRRGSRNPGGAFDEIVQVELLDSKDPQQGLKEYSQQQASWYEIWIEQQLTYVYSKNTSISFAKVSSNLKDWTVIAKAKHISGASYELTGCAMFEDEKSVITGAIMQLNSDENASPSDKGRQKDSKLASSLDSKLPVFTGNLTSKEASSLTFKGQFNELIPSFGEYSTKGERIKRYGGFTDSKLDGEGISYFKEEGLKIYSNYKKGLKEGLSLVIYSPPGDQSKEKSQQEKTLNQQLTEGDVVYVGNYSQDLKQGEGLRIRAKSKQLLYFETGELKTVYEEDANTTTKNN